MSLASTSLPAVTSCLQGSVAPRLHSLVAVELTQTSLIIILMQQCLWENRAGAKWAVSSQESSLSSEGEKKAGRKEHDLFLIGTAAARVPSLLGKVASLVLHKCSRAAEQANGCIANTQEDISESFAISWSPKLTESSSAVPLHTCSVAAFESKVQS